MGEKCGVSTLVLHTVSPPFSLSLSLAVLAISSLFLTHAELLMVNSLHFRHVLQLYMCTFDERTHTHTCVFMRELACALSALFHPSHLCMRDSLVQLPSHSVTCVVCVVDVSLYFGGCMCVSSLQARVENQFLDYKDLAALPKVKAIYEVQQPDLISSSYQPYQRYTSDDRLESYTYGEVLLPHTCQI